MRRQQVQYARRRGLSCRRGCALLSVARSSLHYVSKRRRPMRRRSSVMRELAAQYPRYGYRRIRIFLRRQGHAMSTDRAHRLWRVAGLQLPRKRPRRRVAASRPRPTAARRGPNHVWAYDFVFDACAERSEAQVPDDRRRVDARVTRDRRRRKHPLAARHRRAQQTHQRARRAALPALATTAPSSLLRAILRWLDDEGIETAHIASGQAVAERRERKLQRPPPRRVPEHGVVPHSRRGRNLDRDRGAGTTTRSVPTRALATSRPTSSKHRFEQDLRTTTERHFCREGEFRSSIIG